MYIYIYYIELVLNGYTVLTELVHDSPTWHVQLILEWFPFLTTIYVWKHVIMIVIIQPGFKSLDPQPILAQETMVLWLVQRRSESTCWLKMVFMW